MRSGGCIFIVVTVGASIATQAIIGKIQADAAEESAKKQENLQLIANAKSETRAKMQAKIQDKINDRNEKIAKAQVASSVALEKIYAERARMQTAKARQNYIEKYNMGKPVA